MSFIIESNHTYVFKAEFCIGLGISKYQMDRRKKDLLIWLTNFYDYTIIPGSPERIKINEVFGDYEPMPRKVTDRAYEKQKDYEEFAFASLTPEFKPNSKRKVARDAIKQFGNKKYKHRNVESVARRYISKPFEKYGENDGQQVWVYFSSYAPMPTRTVDKWRQLLSKYKISETEASNAFYKYAQGDNIDLELGYYRCALAEFQEIYDDTPVLVKRWRLKKEYQPPKDNDDDALR